VLDKASLRVLAAALDRLDAGFASLPEIPSEPGALGSTERVLMEVAGRLQDNYPYFHPLYAGQMLKPPHPVARLAYALAMWINPNNHALDGGRASSAMEKEAIAGIAAMFGWKTHLGHLTGGGTMANLEALWVAGQLRPGETIVASEQAHYTHARISKVLGLAFESIPTDRRGRMDVDILERRIQRGRVGTVVVTMGTTATGSVDPLVDILDLQMKYGCRIHADAAYGGYFTLTNTLDKDTRAAFDCISEADSIVIDPHKHGLQPYGCGCVLFRDPSVGRFYKHDSPYTYFSSGDLHLGEISLECSRPGAAAVGLWATQRLMPLVKEGEFAEGLERGRGAALALFGKLEGDGRFVTAFRPELDILVFTPNAATVSDSSLRSRSVFDEAARNDLHLALAELPTKFFKLDERGITQDRETILALRSVLMKPEHLEWVPEIWQRLDRATAAVTTGK
jgi:tyrosine decarboxylase/aspartate 1-decarboxylase